MPVLVKRAEADAIIAETYLRLQAKKLGLTGLRVPDFWTSQAHSSVQTQYGVKPFVPFPWQRTWIGEGRTDYDAMTYDNLSEFYRGITRREMILKARDVGSSVICVRWLCWLQLRFGGDVLIKADVHDNAKNLIDIARHYLASLPVPERPTLTVDNETELQHQRGTIRALARGRGRSERCRYLLKTERAFWENSAEEEAAISGALVAGGWLIQESTANGFNDYHADWVDSASGYRKTFVGRDDNPTHDSQWLAEKQAELSKQGKSAQQEYPGCENEAFVTTGNCVFDVEIVQQYLADARSPLNVSQNGAVSVWVKPVVARDYVAGVDVAEGIDIGNDRLDYSHLAIYDRSSKHVASLHGQWAPDVFAQLVYDLCEKYHYPYLAVERNSVGQVVLLKLLELEYPTARLHYSDDADAALKRRQGLRSNPVLGWRTTRKSKAELTAGFGAAITARDIDCRDARLWDQCLSYVHQGDGSTGAMSNCHDDIVMAHMIALQMVSCAPLRSGGAVPLTVGVQWKG